MKVIVKLFAGAKQIARRDTVELEVDSSATIETLRTRLAEQFPELGGLLRHAMFAVDTEYVSPDTRLAANQEVVCIPPVSGG